MKIGIFANIRKTKVREVLCSLLDWIGEREIEIVMSRELSDWLQDKKYSTIVVCWSAGAGSR